MRHIVCFSGGKDSTALVLWAIENLGTPGVDFIVVFCDTGWESKITTAYIEEINRTLLNGTLVVLKTAKYGRYRIPVPVRKPTARNLWRFQCVMDAYLESVRTEGMRKLVQIKGRVPSAKARFCTEALKILPMGEWLKTLDGDSTIYEGIRADESEARSRKPAREWAEHYESWLERPLLRWSVEMVFAMMAKHNVKPNPLYLLGAHRVGCFPCVLVNQRELKALLRNTPEVRERIVELETITGCSFFPPNYIPSRFQTGFDEASGKRFPWSNDVFRYIESVDEDQLPMFAERSCMSVYNLCE